MLNSFREYSYLFDKFIEEGSVGICRWIESGDTVDTVLPELKALVDDKEEWRAVILAPGLAENGDPEAIDVVNPFDFSEENNSEGIIEESRIPLVRLTQILGGVPAPDVSFKKEEIQEEGRVTRIVYRPVVDSEAEKRHLELAEKYRYNAPYPSEVVLVSLRLLYEETMESLTRKADALTTVEETDFWRKNRYPDVCRFVVFDLENHGSTRRCANMLEFWLSVLILATNHIKASSFQAYHLYKIKLRFDRDLMRQRLQAALFRIKGAREYINDTILVDARLRDELRTQIPDYEVSVPVNVSFPQRKKQDYGRVSALPVDINSDIREWNNSENEYERDLDSITDAVDNAFDKTSDVMRNVCLYPELDVHDLSDYQQTEMSKDLAERFREILRMQGSLPQNDKRRRSEMHAASKKVRTALRSRISRNIFATIMMIVAVLLLVSHVPLFIYHFSHKFRTVALIILVCLVLWAIYCLVGVLIALYQKKKVEILMRRYTYLVNNEFAVVKDNSNLYSDYMSEIASHSRGSSFLYYMRNKKRMKNRLIMLQHRYLNVINDLQQSILLWGAANYVELNTQSAYSEKIRIPDKMTEASLVALILGIDNGFKIPINNTGDTIETPFDFIEKLELVREEEYEYGE